MALFDFGKKKRKLLLVLAAAVVRQVKQKKLQRTAAPKQRTKSIALRC